MFQAILSSNENTEKVYFYKLLHNFLGKGLITSSGKLREIYSFV
jgi:cytochrome P450 family 4